MRKLGLLDPSVVIIDSTQARAVGGEITQGQVQSIAGKKGSKVTLVVDRNGVPFVFQTAPSNRSDHDELISAAESIPQIGGLPGRPKSHPDKIYADAGYDSDLHRDILQFMGREPLIRRRRSQDGSQLGKIQWVVERTISWIKRLRRMRTRSDRTDTTVDAFTTLSSVMICFQMSLSA